MLWEELLVFGDEFGDPCVCISMNFLILAKRWVLEVLNGEDELFFCEMGAIQDSIFLCFEILWVCFGHLLAPVNKVAHRIDDMILNVLNQSVDKWASDLSDPALDPDVIMQEISLSCKNTKIERKCVILTIDNRNETISDLLGNIEDS